MSSNNNKILKRVLGIWLVYMLWVVVSYVSVHMYVWYCVPWGWEGLVSSVLGSQMPHCIILRRLINTVNLWQRVCIEVCIDPCIEICIDPCIEICIDPCIDACIYPITHSSFHHSFLISLLISYFLTHFLFLPFYPPYTIPLLIAIDKYPHTGGFTLLPTPDSPLVLIHLLYFSRTWDFSVVLNDNK